MPTNAERGPNKTTKIVLFLSHWLLVLLLAKRFHGSTGDEVDFLLKNLRTIVIAMIGAAGMLRLLLRVILKAAIAVIWITTILIVVVLQNFFGISLSKTDEDFVLRSRQKTVSALKYPIQSCLSTLFASLIRFSGRSSLRR